MQLERSKNCIVADRLGGQVNETLNIENYIGLKQTEGTRLAADLEGHVRDYDVDTCYQQS